MYTAFLLYLQDDIWDGALCSSARMCARKHARGGKLEWVSKYLREPKVSIIQAYSKN